MKKLQSPSNSSYRARRLYRLGYRLRFLAADCICALATASVLLVVLTSCAPTRYIPMPSSHTRDSTHLTTDRRMDSTFYFVHDSMSIRMVSGTAGISGTAGPSPDTVYVDRWHTIFKDRWHTLSHTDTITVTQHDSIPYPVEVPIEVPTPIPRFYKNCTAGFFLILLCIILYVFLRIYLRR